MGQSKLQLSTKTRCHLSRTDTPYKFVPAVTAHILGTCDIDDSSGILDYPLAKDPKRTFRASACSIPLPSPSPSLSPSLFSSLSRSPSSDSGLFDGNRVIRVIQSILILSRAMKIPGKISDSRSQPVRNLHRSSRPIDPLVHSARRSESREIIAW